MNAVTRQLKQQDRRRGALELAKSLATEFASRAATADANGALPQADLDALKDSGLLGLTVPTSYGGLGAGLSEAVRLQLELAKGSAATGLVIAMTLHIVGREAELESWPPRIREKIFSGVARGELLNSAASEPRLGSPSRGGLPDTYAETNGEKFVIHGHKNWVTGGEHLKHLLVRLRIGEQARVLYVPGNTPNIRWEKTWGNALSLRASDSHDVYFEGARVPAQNLLPITQSPPLIWFPLLMAANYLGTGLAARDEVIHYTLERVPTALDKPIATLPKIQRQLGEIETELQAAQTLLRSVADEWRGSGHAKFLPKVAAAKHLAVETALSVTDKAMRIAGAAAIDKGLALERYFRDARGGLVHPPSGDAGLELIGKAALEGFM